MFFMRGYIVCTTPIRENISTRRMHRKETVYPLLDGIMKVLDGLRLHPAKPYTDFITPMPVIIITPQTRQKETP